MVVAAFPLAKIGLLLLKQLSKPLANFIRDEAKKHPTIRRYVIMPTGRAYGYVENLAAIRKSNKPEEVEELTEEEIVELGANAIGEIILFSLLSLIIIAEVSRQGDKKAEIQRTKDEQLSNLQQGLVDVLQEVNDLKSSVNKLKKQLKGSADILELEQLTHNKVTDQNFYDLMTGKTKKNPVDVNSPSI